MIPQTSYVWSLFKNLKIRLNYRLNVFVGQNINRIFKEKRLKSRKSKKYYLLTKTIKTNKDPQSRQRNSRHWFSWQTKLQSWCFSPITISVWKFLDLNSINHRNYIFYLINPLYTSALANVSTDHFNGLVSH